MWLDLVKAVCFDWGKKKFPDHCCKLLYLIFCLQYKIHMFGRASEFVTLAQNLKTPFFFNYESTCLQEKGITLTILEFWGWNLKPHISNARCVRCNVHVLSLDTITNSKIDLIQKVLHNGGKQSVKHLHMCIWHVYHVSHESCESCIMYHMNHVNHVSCITWIMYHVSHESCK